MTKTMEHDAIRVDK